MSHFHSKTSVFGVGGGDEGRVPKFMQKSRNPQRKKSGKPSKKVRKFQNWESGNSTEKSHEIGDKMSGNSYGKHQAS